MLSDIQHSLKSELNYIHHYCTSTRQSVAVAESVTAGCLQLLLSTAPFAQEFFQGGITVYNCAQKAIHLNIEPIFSDKCNGVSQEIATAMAFNACSLFRSRIGIGITGYATKVPEEGIDHLYAFFAVAMQEKLIRAGRIEPEGEGIDAQWSYTATLLRHLAKALEVL